MNSSKQLMINIISNIIAYGTSLAITFILTPYLINTLGSDIYSFFPMANNFVSYFLIITNALNSMASRFITVSISRKDFKSAQEYFSSVFFSNVILAAILAIVFSVVLIFLPYIFNIPPTDLDSIRWLFALVFIASIINIFTAVFGVAVFATNRLDMKSGAEIIQGVIRLILFVILYSIFKPSIMYVGIVTLVIAVINLCFQLFFTRRLLPDFKISTKYFNWLAVKEIFTSGIWNSLNSLGNILLVSMALILSNILIGATASGDLSIVQTIPNFITSIISVLFTVFMPRINYAFASDNISILTQEIKFSQKLLGLFTTTPIILIILFGTPFFQLWIGVDYERAQYLNSLSIITIIPLIIHANMWTVYGITIAMNKVKKPAIILILFGIANVVITYVLLEFFDFGQWEIYIIPTVSSLFSILYYFGYLLIYVSKEMGTSWKTFYPSILKSIGYTLILYVLAHPIVSQLVIDSWIKFLLYGGIAAIIGYVLQALILLNKEEIGKTISFMLRRGS